MEAFKLIADLGFSIAAVIGGGFFIIMLLRYILESVTSKVQALDGMLSALNNRVRSINNEIIRLDALICTALGVKPDVRRIAAADGKEDARKD
jgi:predicted choloylglycine hydrolase|tara:strand:- start:73 stop:351 length:279 start_codon:yes stop_codon:yes gene_type:complete